MFGLSEMRTLAKRMDELLSRMETCVNVLALVGKRLTEKEAVKVAPRPTLPPPTKASKQRKKYEQRAFRAFAKRQPPGTEYTAKEICEKLDIQMVTGTKAFALILKAEGWVRMAKRRARVSVFKKPM